MGIYFGQKEILYTKLYKASSARSDDTNYLQISRLISPATYTFWLSICRLLSKFWHIKRVAGYIFCTGKNGMSIVISSISCQVRWHQILPDVTLHLVSCVYILIINIRFSLSKLWHIKRVAGYLFYTRNNLMHFIISSIICHDRWY